MKNKKTYLIVGLIILIAVGFMVKRKIEYMREPTPLKPVVTLNKYTARIGEIKDYQRYLGYFKPENRAMLASRVTARILYIAGEGIRVKKGDVVVKLDVSDLEAQYEAMKVKYENQRKVFERDKVLYEAKAISQQQYEFSETMYKQAKALYERAKKQLDYAVIKSPFDGIVGKRFFNEGDMAVMAKPIVRIDGTEGGYDLYVDVPVDLMNKLKVGSKHEIIFNSQKMPCKLKAVVSSVNNLATLRFEVNSNTLNIPPDTYINVNIYTAREKGVIIPKNSILTNEKGSFALTVVNGKVQWKKINLGQCDWDYCVVKGINAGEVLGVATPQNIALFYNGEPVRLI